MASFELGETAICSLTIYNHGTTTKVDPTTSITVSIFNLGGAAVSAQAMTKTTTGEYYYDYTTTVTGEHSVIYAATSGSRITKLRDAFSVVVAS